MASKLMVMDDWLWVRSGVIWVLLFTEIGASIHTLSLYSGNISSATIIQSMAFSFDLLLPGIALNKAHYSVQLHGWYEYYFYVHKIMGFVLASFLIAGLSGLSKK